MDLKNIVVELGNKKGKKLNQVKVEGISFDSSAYYALVLDFDLEQKIGTCQVFKKNGVLFANVYFYPHLYKETLPLYLEMFPIICTTFREDENPLYKQSKILNKCNFEFLSLTNSPNGDNNIKCLKDQIRVQKDLIEENPKNQRYFIFTAKIASKLVEFNFMTNGVFPSRKELMDFLKLNHSSSQENPIIVFIYEFKTVEDYLAYNEKN